MAINEVKSSGKHKLNLYNYNTYRLNRPCKNPGEGLLLLVNKNIKHSLINVNNNLKTIKAIGVRLEGNTAIFSVYARPTIDKVVNKIAHKIIFKLINTKHYSIIAPDRYTLYPTNGGQPSIVDLAIAKNINTSYEIEAINDLDSDHFLIILNLDYLDNLRHNPAEYLDYKNTDWKRLRQVINNKLQINYKITTISEIDNTIEDLTPVIDEAKKSNSNKDCAKN